MHSSFLTTITAGTLTFVTSVCHVLLCTAMFAFVYQLPHISPTLRGQFKKLKHVTFTRQYCSHVRGLGAWLNPTGTLHFLGAS